MRKLGFIHTFQLLIFLLIYCFQQATAQQSKVVRIISKEEAKKVEIYRHKINFFFGNYWNVTSKPLMSAKVQIKNLKASGKMSKARKLEQSEEFHQMKLNDLKERAYIANEYGLFGIDYVNEKGIENLSQQEKIFIEKAIYRSLSGPVSNKLGYKRLLATPEGRVKLHALMTAIINDYQTKINQQDYFSTLELPESIRKIVEKSLNESSEEKINSFCAAALSTYKKYAAQQKAMRELNVGNYGIKAENSELVKMSCKDKRVIVYKMISKISS